MTDPVPKDIELESRLKSIVFALCQFSQQTVRLWEADFAPDFTQNLPNPGLHGQLRTLMQFLLRIPSRRRENVREPRIIR